MPAVRQTGVAAAGGWPELGCLRAMAYVTTRRWLHQVRGAGGRPWDLVALVLGVAFVAVAQGIFAAGPQARPALSGRPLDLAVVAADLAAAGLLARSTFSSPLRPSVADASWLLTAPGGARALVCRSLLVRPVSYALMAGLGTLASAWWRPGFVPADMWNTALVAADTGLLARLVLLGGDMVSGRPAGGRALRGLAAAWALALLVALALDPPWAAWVEIRPLARLLVTGLLQAASVPTASLLAALAALTLLAVALVVSSRGFEERAATTAHQVAEAQETLRRSRSGQEWVAQQYRSGLPPLRGYSVLAGEAALCYRALAQERRSLGVSTVQLLGAVVVTGVLVALAARWALVPAIALLLIGAASGGVEGLAVELDHYHLRSAPMRRLRALLWVSIVPIVRNSLMAEVLWLAALVVPGAGLGTWLAGMLLIPCTMWLAAGAGCVAAATTDTIWGRLAFSLALTLIGLVPAAGLVLLLSPRGTVELAAGAVPAVLLAGAAWFVLARWEVWNGARARW